MSVFLNASLYQDLLEHKDGEFTIDVRRHRLAKLEGGELLYLRPIQVWTQREISGLMGYRIRVKQTKTKYGAGDVLYDVPPWAEVIIQ